MRAESRCQWVWAVFLVGIFLALGAEARAAAVGHGTRAFITKCYGNMVESDFQQLADARFTMIVKETDLVDPINNSLSLAYIPSFCTLAANVGLDTGTWQGGMAPARLTEAPKVSRKGVVSEHGTPISVAGWYAVGTSMVQYVNISLTRPNYKLLVLNFETFDGSGEFGESYDNMAFVGFFQQTGRTVPNPLPALNARYDYIYQNGLLNEYISFQYNIVLREMRRIRQRIDAVNPGFQIGVYGWGPLLEAVKEGITTEAAPMLDMDLYTYARGPYDGTRGGWDWTADIPDRPGLKWSLTSASSQCRAAPQRSYPAIFLPGHLTHVPGPADGSQYRFTVRQAFNSATYACGYWVWTDAFIPSPWTSMRDWINATMAYFQQANTALINGDFTWSSRQPDSISDPNATTPIPIVTFTGQKATSWDPVTGAKLAEAPTQELPSTTAVLGDADTIIGDENITLTDGQVHIWDPFSGTELLRFNVGTDQVRIRLGGVPNPSLPPVVSFSVAPGDTANRLSWTNPEYAAFARTMIRCRTDAYPTSPTDGTLVCDRASAPGSSDAFLHKGLTNRVYYYTAFAHDTVYNYSTGVNASGVPYVTNCVFEPFSYTNGLLSGRGGWSGTSGSQIEVVDGTLRVLGGAGSGDAASTVSCGSQNGIIWVHCKVKSGAGGVTMWSLYIDDTLGRNLARWYGAGTTARGRIGGGGQVTGQQMLTGGWDDLHVIIYTATNHSDFYFNGLFIGRLDHAETGAGDSVGRIRFERIDNSLAQGGEVFFDDLAIGTVDTTITGRIILGDYAGNVTQTPVTVELRKQGGATTTRTIYLDSGGNFTLTGIEAGTYDIAFKASHWLREVIRNVQAGP